MTFTARMNKCTYITLLLSCIWANSPVFPVSVQKRTLAAKIDSLKQIRQTIRGELDDIDRMIALLQRQKWAAQPNINAEITTSVRLSLESDTGTSPGVLIPTLALVSIIDYLPVQNVYKIQYQGLTGFVPANTINETEKIQGFKTDRRSEYQREMTRLKQLQAEIESHPLWIKVANAPLRAEAAKDAGTIRYLDRGQLVFMRSQEKEWLFVNVENERFAPDRFYSPQDFQRSYAQGWLHNREVSADPIPQEQVQQSAEYPMRPEDRAIGHLSLGMSMKMVAASWGEPLTKLASGAREQWLFAFDLGFQIVYFDNGRLIGWTADNSFK